MPTTPPRFPWPPFVAALTLLVLIGIAPMLSALAAEVIARLNGCELNEGASHPCEMLGLELGGTLYNMFVMGWLALATIPLAAIGLLLWLVVLVVAIIVHRVRKSKAARLSRCLSAQGFSEHQSVR